MLREMAVASLTGLMLLTGYEPAQAPEIRVEVREVIKEVPVLTLVELPLESQEMDLEISAYAIHGNTSTGLHTDKGIIAVDPTIIPYGTIIHVPDVGYCIAADCGGAIKGYKADLYLPTEEECIQWGRRVITVEIINMER